MLRAEMDQVMQLLIRFMQDKERLKSVYCKIVGESKNGKG